MSKHRKKHRSKKRNKVKAKWIDRALFFSTFCIGICFNEKDFKHEVKRISRGRITPPEWLKIKNGATRHIFRHKVENNFVLVCIRPEKDIQTTEIAYLVHESVHIWQDVKSDIGEDNPSEEFEAYAIQSISQGLIQEYINRVLN